MTADETSEEHTTATKWLHGDEGAEIRREHLPSMPRARVLHPLTIDGDGSQDNPRRPLGQIFYEDQGHEGTDEDQIGLLQLQRTLPVDADHPHCPEVPDDHPHCWVVHGQIIGLKHFSGKEERGGVNVQSLDSLDVMSLPAAAG